MKANELMIGDWVYSASMTPRKVQYLDGAKSDSIGVADHLNFESRINPIPLTAEILEKNGLKYEVDYGGYHRSILGSHSKDNEPLICVQWNPQGEISQWEVSNKSGILTGVVAYGYTEIAVHELQHILRMVGLNELANNFKIE